MAAPDKQLLGIMNNDLVVANEYMGLQALPIEILHPIIHHLDPVSIIALSQTSHLLRRAVSPRKGDFINRLLILECLEEHGGYNPVFKIPYSCFPVRPHWDSQGWEKNRWACTSCLQLLPHSHFSNEMLLKVSFRKPLPNTHAADNLPFHWQPSLHGKPWGRKALARMSKEERNARRPSRGMRWAQRKAYYAPQPLNVHIDALKSACSLGYEHLPERLEEAEKAATLDAKSKALNALTSQYGDGFTNWGWKRYLRKCRECQYQGGHFKTYIFRGINVPLPILYARPVIFDSVSLLQRLFPQYWVNMEHKKPTIEGPTVTFARLEARGTPTFMVRCPACTGWYEYREFRHNEFISGEEKEIELLDYWQTLDLVARRSRWEESWLGWDPRRALESIQSDWTCQSCFAEKYGRQELGKVLVRSIHQIQIQERAARQFQLVSGFGSVRDHLFKAYDEGDESATSLFLPDDWALLRRLVSDVEPLIERLRTGFGAFEPSEVEMVRSHISELNRIWEKAVGGYSAHTNYWTFDEWKSSYEDIIVYWYWIEASIVEVEANPDILVDHVLAK